MTTDPPKRKPGRTPNATKIPATMEQLRKTADALRLLEEQKTYRAMDFYKPYPKQQEFLDLGLSKRERLFMAGNRVGKSTTGAFEMAVHLTGQYPDWWLGRRFDRPVKAWAASLTGLSTRDVVQTQLCGSYAYPAKYGTGMIPRAAVNWKTDVSLARGVTDLFDTVLVTHRTNGVIDGKSVLTFKTYEQGAKKWQGEAVDVVWNDEEPDEEVYAEGMARIAPTNPLEEGGLNYTTFTPLLGKSKVVARFLDEPSPDRVVVRMTMDDALHINAEAKKTILDGYLSWQREARSKGVPLLGSGRIFNIDEATITEQPFEIPLQWSLIWGLDPGVGHPFGAVLIAWDKDADVIHVIHAVRMKDALPIQQAAAMKPWRQGHGAKVPVAWPQDATQRKEFQGKLMPLSKIYRVHGLNMLAEHARWPDGSNSTEIGILEMQERMASNRFKVFAHLGDWFEEFREYHRKDGEIVQKGDDLMSATRVAVMDKRHAKAVLWVSGSATGRVEVRVARDVDIGPWDN